MNATELLTIIVGFFPWGFIKVAILTLVAMYIVFAAIIVRQEQLMTRVVEISFSPMLRMVAVVHFIASVIALFLVLVLL